MFSINVNFEGNTPNISVNSDYSGIQNTSSNSNNSIFLTGTTSAMSESSKAEKIRYGIFENDKGVNGVIDEGVFQGKKGDCWLISGILSLSYTPNGAKLIKEAISQNNDGSYNVHLKGINKTYTITQNELNSKNVSVIRDALNKEKSAYSTGDDDMLLMELAIEKGIKDKSINIQTSDGITGGSAYYLYGLLTENEVAYAYGKDNNSQLRQMLDYYGENQNNCAVTVGVIDGFDGLEDDHAYALKSMNNNSVTLVNPWNSLQEIKVSLSDMLKNSTNYDLSLVDYRVFGQQTQAGEYYA